MNESLLAGRYAKALLAHADEVGEADLLYPLFRRLCCSLRTISGVACAVDNPTISSSIRSGMVIALAGEEVPESFKRFVALLFGHKREGLLGEIGRSYLKLYRSSRGLIHVELATASEMDAATLSRVEELVARREGGRVEMEVVVRPELIGGFVIKVDGKVLDGSISGELERIRRAIVGTNQSVV